jgi:hypothetical protein
MHRCFSSCHGSWRRWADPAPLRAAGGSAGLTIGRILRRSILRNRWKSSASGPSRGKGLKAFQKFQAMRNEDLAKIQAGEDFEEVSIHQDSTPVYSFLTTAYIQTGAVAMGLPLVKKICN